MADLRDRLQEALGDVYRLERELPGGGMSRLFLATEASLGRQVVIKLLPPDTAGEVSVARFQREIQTAATLQHPHILPIHTAGSRGDLLYYETPTHWTRMAAMASLGYRLAQLGAAAAVIGGAFDLFVPRLLSHHETFLAVAPRAAPAPTAALVLLLLHTLGAALVAVGLGALALLAASRRSGLRWPALAAAGTVLLAEGMNAWAIRRVGSPLYVGPLLSALLVMVGVSMMTAAGRRRSAGGPQERSRAAAVSAALLAIFVPATVHAQSALDLERIADAIVRRAGLRPGERILLVGEAGRFDPLVPLLRAAITRAGATDLGALTGSGAPLAGAPTPFVHAAAGLDRAALAAHFRDVDLAVMLPGAEVAHPPYAAMQDVLREGRGRTIHFHWTGASDLNGIPIPESPRVDSVYQRALLETDYVALAGAQRALESAMRSAETRVTTPQGTDLRFQIGNRPFTRQDGDASALRAEHARNLIDREIELPAGAIRVAPIEESVSGTIALPLSAWNGRPVRDLVLRLERGRIVEIRAAEGREAVVAELTEGGEGACWFREMALGLNPLLAIPEDDPWIPYYGYGAGVVRLSLGDNRELGGTVGGGYVRWNFFINATVTVGDDTWVADGKVVSRRLPRR
ncbi:MAG TPA: aminopeptidase [Gemmatimonadaceae bacterium]|nr:aminopeptidase [Gemmatimonadaceae bacterium]